VVSYGKLVASSCEAESPDFRRGEYVNSVYVSIVGILEHRELENTIKELKTLDEALVEAGLHMDFFRSVCELKDNNGTTVDFISELIKDNL
jgi:hypothetical protein